MKCYGKDSGAKVRTFFESTKFFMLKLKKTKTCLSFFIPQKTHSGTLCHTKRTPRRWVDLHVQFLRGACLTLQLIPGGSLPSVAHFRFGCDCKGTANICVFQIYCVKKTEIHKYSCGILRRFGFICLPLQTQVAKVGI